MQNHFFLIYLLKISFCLLKQVKSALPNDRKSVQINHQLDATLFQFIILTFIYSSTCFGRFPAHHRFPARPRTQHDYYHNTKVKPEAATAVTGLLMMDGKTSESCWAVNKRQDNKLKNCYIWLVIYLNCTMMHGLTNLKFKDRKSVVTERSLHLFHSEWSQLEMSENTLVQKHSIFILKTNSSSRINVLLHLKQGEPPWRFLTLRWLMSYIYGAPILDVSRSHTTTQHSR